LKVKCDEQTNRTAGPIIAAPQFDPIQPSHAHHNMELTYPYKPKPWSMVFAVLAFGTLAIYMGNMAMNNDQGFTLGRALALSPRGASILYWCIVAVVIAFLIVVFTAYYVAVNKAHQVILTRQEISAPKYGISRLPTVIPLAEINTLEVQTMQRQRFLHINHRAGRLSIAASHLPNREAFDELCVALARKVQECRGESIS
jgi:hypothetical protein